jgi:hypothetical protein
MCRGYGFDPVNAACVRVAIKSRRICALDGTVLEPRTPHGLVSETERTNIRWRDFEWRTSRQRSGSTRGQPIGLRRARARFGSSLRPRCAERRVLPAGVQSPSGFADGVPCQPTPGLQTVPRAPAPGWSGCAGSKMPTDAIWILDTACGGGVSCHDSVWFACPPRPSRPSGGNSKCEARELWCSERQVLRS